VSDRVLSQEEIDSVFRSAHGSAADDPSKKTQPYDFRRPDRIAKDQLRAIHLLHENFARSLASSLSAYLRAYVIVNLISVEQLSFHEFTASLQAPTCLATLSMRPLEGNAVLELNSALTFPVLEMLLGGNGRSQTKFNREITEIEQSILDGMLRIILQNLKNAWHSVTNLDFAIEYYETEPSLLQILAPNEALVTISMEVRIGDTSGVMNIGIPSIIIKMLRQKFDQQWSVRKSDMTADEEARIYRLISPSVLHADARLQGPTITVGDMMHLKLGDVVQFDYTADKPIDMMLNGRKKYRGRIVPQGRKKAFVVEQLFTPTA